MVCPYAVLSLGRALATSVTRLALRMPARVLATKSERNSRVHSSLFNADQNHSLIGRVE